MILRSDGVVWPVCLEEGAFLSRQGGPIHTAYQCSWYLGVGWQNAPGPGWAQAGAPAHGEAVGPAGRNAPALGPFCFLIPVAGVVGAAERLLKMCLCLLYSFLKIEEANASRGSAIRCGRACSNGSF